MSKKAPLIDKSAETLTEMHDTHLRRLNLVESKKDQASPDLVDKTYKSVSKGFKEALTCGDADAAPIVAYLQANGLGCEKNSLKTAEWVEIGAQLGNTACQDLKSHQNPDFNDDRMTSLYHALFDNGEPVERVFSPGVISTSISHVRAIRENIEKYNTTTAVLESSQVVKCIEHFERAAVGLYVYNENDYSFPKEEGCHCCLVM